MRVMKASIRTVMIIAFVAVSGCGKTSTPEQAFGSMMAVVRAIESGKRPNSALDDYFYRSPRQKEGYIDAEIFLPERLNDCDNTFVIAFYAVG